MHGETKPEVQFLLCVCVWLSKSTQASFVHICILLVLSLLGLLYIQQEEHILSFILDWLKEASNPRLERT